MARTAIGDVIIRGHFRQELPYIMVNDVSLGRCGDLVPKAQTNKNKKDRQGKDASPCGETDILALQSHQFTADQHAPNFGGARPDFHQLGIAENPADRAVR